VEIGKLLTVWTMLTRKFPSEDRLSNDSETVVEQASKNVGDGVMALKYQTLWRARRDLNPQPSDPKSDALSS
jgi:uncharacterized protein YbaP (TraB family)